jgi:HD domain
VRLHPYMTERILGRSTTLGRLGAIAAQHHERLDGSGYHRATRGAQVSRDARLLGAADMYHALLEAPNIEKILDDGSQALALTHHRGQHILTLCLGVLVFGNVRSQPLAATSSSRQLPRQKPHQIPGQITGRHSTARHG